MKLSTVSKRAISMRVVGITVIITCGFFPLLVAGYFTEDENGQKR